MNKLITILLSILLCISCGTIKPSTNIETIYNYIDTTIVHTVDSTVLIPRERIVDIVPEYNHLVLETDMAKAEAYLDTTLHALRGSIENKKDIQYKYKYIYKDKIVYRDSLITVEKPVEVPVPVKTHYPYEKWLWIISILSLLYVGYKIYVKAIPKV